MSGPATPTNQGLPGFPTFASTPAKPVSSFKPFLTPQPMRPQNSGLFYQGKFGESSGGFGQQFGSNNTGKSRLELGVLQSQAKRNGESSNNQNGAHQSSAAPFRQSNQAYSSLNAGSGGGGLGFGSQTPMPTVTSSEYKSMFTRGAQPAQRQGRLGTFASLMQPPRNQQQSTENRDFDSPARGEHLNASASTMSPTTPVPVVSTPPPCNKPPETPVKSARTTRVPSFCTPHLAPGNVAGGARSAQRGAWISPVPQQGMISDYGDSAYTSTPQHQHHGQQQVQQHANRNPFSPYLGSRLVSTRTEAQEPLSSHASIVVVEQSLPEAAASAAPTCPSTPANESLRPASYNLGSFPQFDASLRDFDASPQLRFDPACGSPQRRSFDRTSTQIYLQPAQANHESVMNSSGGGSLFASCGQSDDAPSPGRYATPTKTLNMSEMREHLGAVVESGGTASPQSGGDSSAEAPSNRRGVRGRSSSITWNNGDPIPLHQQQQQQPTYQQQQTLFEQPSQEPRFAFHHRVPWKTGQGESDTEAVALAQDVNGTIWLGTGMVDGMPYAVKQVIDKNLLNPVEVEALHLSTLTPHIVRLYNVFTHNLPPQTPSSGRQAKASGQENGLARSDSTILNVGAMSDSVQVIQTEYFSRGCLLENLLRRSQPVSEAEVRKIMQQVLLGLQTLHNDGIAHGNLTLLCVYVDNEGTYKIGNMGASRRVNLPDDESPNLNNGEDNATPNVLPAMYDPTHHVQGGDQASSGETPFTRDVYSFAMSFLHVLWISLLKAHGTAAQLADASQRDAFSVDSLAHTVPNSGNAATGLAPTQCYSNDMLCAFRSLTHPNPRERMSAAQALEALNPVPSTLLHHIFTAYEKEIATKKAAIKELRKRKEEDQLHQEHQRLQQQHHGESESSLASPPCSLEGSANHPQAPFAMANLCHGLSLFGSFANPGREDGTPRPGSGGRGHRRTTSSSTNQSLFGPGPQHRHSRTPTTSVFDDSMDSLTPHDTERKMAFIAETVQATRPTAFIAENGSSSTGSGDRSSGRRKGSTSPLARDADPIVDICNGSNLPLLSRQRGGQSQLDAVVELSLRQLAEKIPYVPLANAPIIV